MPDVVHTNQFPGGERRLEHGSGRADGGHQLKSMLAVLTFAMLALNMNAI